MMIKLWKLFAKKLERMCECIENKFTACIGEKVSKTIGDFFLFSFVVSSPKNEHQNKYSKLEIVENYENYENCENIEMVKNPLAVEETDKNK